MSDKLEHTVKYVYKWKDGKMRKLNVLEEIKNIYKLDYKDSFYTGIWYKSEFELTQEKAIERGIEEMLDEKDRLIKQMKKVDKDISSLTILGRKTI
ncbi:MAG: hypothetical protein GY870_04635 [archaeon]|nr:hypothetical protein [archaeon]